MGRGTRGGKDPSSRRPVDLTGIISVAERNDLLTLVTAITEKMHLEITNSFDSPPITPIDSQDDHHHWLSLSLPHLKENKPPSSSSGTTFYEERTKPYKKVHQVSEKEEAGAMGPPQLRELKKEALAYFRKWQSSVIQRIRDININNPVMSSGSSRGRGRGVRSGPRGRGGRNCMTSRGNLTLATGTPCIPADHVDPHLASRRPPTPNPLWTLHIEKRKQILHIMLLLVLSMQDFNANARLLLVGLASSLNISLKTYHRDEVRIAQGLAETTLEHLPDDEDEERPLGEGQLPRKGKTSLSNNPNTSTNLQLATPLINAGIGGPQAGLGITTVAAARLLGKMAESSVVMASLFGISANRPTSKMTDALCREIQDFSFLSLQDQDYPEYRDAKRIQAVHRRLRLVISINGFLADCDEIAKPWKCLGQQAEAYTVRWETTALTNLGNSLETAIKSTSWQNARKEISTRTIFSSLIECVWPVSLLKISKIIDNPWSVGMVRAEKAGAVLADAIMRHKFQGDRSVSLIGYSLGARVIYTCLMVLAERRQFGIIDSVVLMGTPAPSESRVWLTLKSVVAGRLVNVYSDQDYILGFLCRTSNVQFGVAGLQEIQGATGVENHKVETLNRGHLGYQNLIGHILKSIGWEDLNLAYIKPERSTNGIKRGVR